MEFTFRFKDSWRVLRERLTREGRELVSGLVGVRCPGEGEMELPADEFGDMILPRFREDASGLHQVGFGLSIVSQLELDEIGSPSHGVRVRQDGGRSAHIALATAKDIKAGERRVGEKSSGRVS